MAKVLKIDITENVTAKFKKDYFEIYANKFLIGRYYVNTESRSVEMEEGYLFQEGRFYKIVETLQDKPAYTEK